MPSSTCKPSGNLVSGRRSVEGKKGTYGKLLWSSDVSATAQSVSLECADSLARLQGERVIWYPLLAGCSCRHGHQCRDVSNVPVTFFALKVAHVPEANHFPRLMIQPRFPPIDDTIRLPRPWNGMPVLVGWEGFPVVREGSRGVLGM